MEKETPRSCLLILPLFSRYNPFALVYLFLRPTRTDVSQRYQELVDRSRVTAVGVAQQANRTLPIIRALMSAILQANF
jgi:hypothetical protein